MHVMANNYSPHHPNRTTASTLVLAFLLLSATVAASVWFVVHSAREVSHISETEALVAKQRKSIDFLFTQLLNAETQAEIATVQYADNSELQRYLNATAQVDTALTILKKMVKDTTQIQRVDSLQKLTWLKRDGIVRLVNALRTENHRGSNLQKQIEALHKSHRPVTMQVEVPVVERGEQVVIERRKRGFFRRLGDAFRRAKDDTVSSSVVQHERVNDTASTQVNIADTLANLLTDVHHNLQRDSLARVRHVYTKSDQLRIASMTLSQRMAALIDHFTTTQQQLITQAIHSEREHRQIAAFKLGAMALLSIVLSGALLIWLWCDICRANRYRKVIEQAKERTERLMTQREQLLLTISHDIKAPVNTILGYMQLLPRSITKQHKELQAVETSAQHLLQLVLALLDFHKLEAGSVTIKPAPTHINQLLQSVADAFSPLAQQKGLLLKVDLQLPPDVWTMTDALRLRQIVDNLMSNAIKYTQHGSITLEALWKDNRKKESTDERKEESTGERKEKSTDERNEKSVDGPNYNDFSDDSPHQLFLRITDTGCGMTQADLDRIFQPFTRVKGSEGQEGTGLGLSITHQLVELLGGNLYAYSELGHGSKFVLSLPLKRCNPPKNSQTEKSFAQAETVSHQKNAPICCAVLDDDAPISCAVLDDDALQLQLTEAMLHNVLPAAASVKAFSHADDLLQWLNEGNRPTWVMTDIEMAEMTGYEVLTAMRQQLQLKHLPVVAMTSHLLVPVSDFKQRGFSDVLFKPFTQNDLLRLMKQFDSPASHTTDAKQSTIATQRSFDALLAFAEGDAEAENAIRKQFASDCHKHLQLLQQALSKRDKAELCRIAHKMLPTFTLIGSPVLQTLQTIENRRNEADWHDDDAPRCDQVIEELKRVIALLSKEI